MRGRFLAWSLFILCAQSLISQGFEGFSTSKFEDFNISKPRIGGHLDVKHAGINVTMGLYSENDRRGSRHEIFHSMKGQRGKGTYGGGNVAHHPRSNKGVASLSASTCFFISKAMLHVILAMAGFSLPYFLTEF